MSIKFDEIRVIETGYNSAVWNMALDEVLMSIVNDTPILRLYGWKPSAVSIGYFQSLEEEVDLDRCKKIGIDVVRRITGGGAVLHDAELTYSFVTRSYPKNIIESYKWICDAIVTGINALGFDAHFAPLNDIVVDGKKVSGNAQTRKNDVLLQHGTLLLDVDIEKMFSVLKVPSEKLRDKMVQTAKDRVIGLRRSFDEVAEAVKRGFAKRFDAVLITYAISSEERRRVESLVKEKYCKYEWTKLR